MTSIFSAGNTYVRPIQACCIKQDTNAMLDLLRRPKLVRSRLGGQGSKVPQILHKARRTHMVFLRSDVLPLPFLPPSRKRLLAGHYLVHRPHHSRR